MSHTESILPFPSPSASTANRRIDAKPFIPIARPSITELEIRYVHDALRSGWVSSQGPYLDAFESAFATYCGTKHALAVANGTVGLHLILAALGVGPSDEVIVPDMTFVATANAVRYTGAQVVFADIDRRTLCIDPTGLRHLITSKTKAIIPVHLYGHAAEMDTINRIAAEFGLLVIEDAAEAHGAEYKSRRVGSLGTAGVFSFFGNKIITTGEGGMVTTNDHNLFSKARWLRDHAMNPDTRYWHDAIGFNYRMTNMQAALGLAQLRRIDALISKRRSVFSSYERRLAGTSGFTLNYTAPEVNNVYWMICIQIKNLDQASRAHLMDKLRQRGIDSRPFFYPISDMPMYERANTPVAHDVSTTGINLPTFYDIAEDDVSRVCEALIEFAEEVQRPAVCASVNH